VKRLTTSGQTAPVPLKDAPRSRREMVGLLFVALIL